MSCCSNSSPPFRISCCGLCSLYKICLGHGCKACLFSSIHHSVFSLAIVATVLIVHLAFILLLLVNYDIFGFDIFYINYERNTNWLRDIFEKIVFYFIGRLVVVCTSHLVIVNKSILSDL